MRRACRVLALALGSYSATVTLADAQPQVPAGYQFLTGPQGTGGHLVATRRGSGSSPLTC